MPFPELTVNETLDFAVTVSGSDDGETIVDNNHLSLDTVISAFDLDKPGNTLIGDQIIRGIRGISGISGISGGEKARTSLAEIFLSNASLQCWDNCTRGLDSTTALKIMKLLQKTTTDQELSVVTSLYQASRAICEVRYSSHSETDFYSSPVRSSIRSLCFTKDFRSILAPLMERENPLKIWGSFAHRPCQ